MMIANASTGRVVAALGTKMNLMLGSSCKIAQVLVANMFHWGPW